jgi:hypothetical protein
MNDNTKAVQDLPSPVEVWVTALTEFPGTQPECRIYGPGEAEVQLPGVSVASALSVRGAEREVTADLVALGYTPIGRWVTRAEDRGEPIEASRAFRLEVAVDG